MTLRFKLLAGFGLCILLAMLAGAFALFSAHQLNGHTDEIAGRWLPAVRAAKDMQVALLETASRVQRHMAATDADRRKAVEATIDQAHEHFAKARAEYAADGRGDEARESLGKLDALMASLLDGEKAVVNLSNMGNRSAAEARFQEKFAPVADDAAKLLGTIVDDSGNGARVAVEHAGSGYGRLRLVTLGSLAAIVLVGAVVAMAITRSVLSQIGGDPRDVAAIAHEIAGGNLTVKVATRDGDDRSLLHAMGQMADALATTVAAVKAAAAQIDAAATEVAAGNGDLSQRTEQQAARLEQASSSMAQLAGAIRMTGDSTKSANDLAAAATETAGRGSRVVQDIVATMNEISGSSRRISDITQVIDGIAFQTNILALNAAVEAARAGDQGRSFAVVASEVRTLAQRCASAAREIKTLIGESAGKVEAGTRLVDDAGRTMTEIVKSIDGVNELIGQVHVASAEQVAGIEQMSDSVRTLDATTQQNAALVEQSAAAAASLKAQATRLNEAVAVFQVN